MKKHVYYMGRVAQRGCGVPILGGAQDPTGHDPEQPAIGEPALGRVWMSRSVRCPQPQRFCDEGHRMTESMTRRWLHKYNDFFI